MNKLFQHRDNCRICKSKEISIILKLQSVPNITPNMYLAKKSKIKSRLVPLNVYLCKDCGFIQLLDIINSNFLYDDYLYNTKISIGLTDHFKTLCNNILNLGVLKKGDFILEFGSNDGSLLKFFKDKDFQVLGIDPAKEIVKKANLNNIPTLVGYFSKILANEISISYGKANLILANNVIANIDDLDSIFEAVSLLLKEDGIFVFETQYAVSLFEDNLLDVIYHEHLSYFSVKPLIEFLKKFSLEIFNVERISPKGGSIRFWLKKSNNPLKKSISVKKLIKLEENTGIYKFEYYSEFTNRITSIRNRLLKILKECKNSGHTVGIYGTSVGCISLIHQFNISEYIDIAFDDYPLKNEIDVSKFKINVYTKDSIATYNPKIIIILAWRYSNIIIKNNSFFTKNGGLFITPLPELFII